MAIRYFELLTRTRLDIEETKQYKDTVKGSHKDFQMPSAKSITLSEFNTVSCDAITAHRIADYRKRRFSLVLLPSIHIVMDDIVAPITADLNALGGM